MILVCIECGRDMEQVKMNEYRCPGCGFVVEQLSIPAEMEPDEPCSAV